MVKKIACTMLVVLPVSLGLLVGKPAILKAGEGGKADKHAAGTNQIRTDVAKLQAQDSHLDKTALTYALKNYYQARAKGLDQQRILTLVDFQKPSTEKRLWVINMQTKKVMMSELVAHAQNSGANYATHFSNDPSTHESSLGLYMTKATYYGHHGYSLRLEGLNPGLNDHAYSRDIVIHSAPYVSNSFASHYGRLGRSWGCFALNPAQSKQVIQAVQNGTLLYAYYPSQRLTSKTHAIVA